MRVSEATLADVALLQELAGAGDRPHAVAALEANEQTGRKVLELLRGEVVSEALRQGIRAARIGPYWAVHTIEVPGDHPSSGRNRRTHLEQYSATDLRARAVGGTAADRTAATAR